MKIQKALLLTLGLFIIIFPNLSLAQSKTKVLKQTATLERPKLVIGIMVDQMRYDYLYRYYDQYQEGGLKRLMNDGFNCRNNQYHYALTITAVGHSSVYSGSIPAITGIVGNDWYDRYQQQKVYCTDDNTVSTVGSNNASVGKMSPRNLLVTTVTDQLRLATNFRSKTIGVAIKDRASILPAGHTANGAYWFDSKTGNFVTSTYYMNTLPQWAQDYNNKKKPAEYAKKGWNTILPISEYTQSTADDMPWEGNLPGEEKPTFPHDVVGRSGDAFGAVITTPWGNTLTKEMAIEAIKGEQLGKGKDTDFLAISFSSPDRIGHMFGPTSIEQQDNYLKLDAEFADLFNFLDSWTGKGNYTVFLTADHGAVDVPGFLKQNKIPAGLIGATPLVRTLVKSLDDAFGEAKYISEVENYQIYLNDSILDAKKITYSDVFKVVRKTLLPMKGIADVVNIKDFSQMSLNSYQTEMYKNTVHAKRSGDIQIIPEAGWVASDFTTGTDHGSPYNYDTHVPFLLYGWGIKKGETLKRTTIADIAPTISALLHILPPSGSVGHPVLEALK